MDKMENNKELIEHLKDVLDNHEEPYQLGSWEKFQAQRKKHNPLLPWKIGFGIAASFAIIMGSLWLLDKSNTVVEHISTIQTTRSFDEPAGPMVAEEALPLEEDIRLETAVAADFSNSKFKQSDHSDIIPLLDLLDGYENLVNHGAFDYLEPMRPVLIRDQKPLASEHTPEAYPVFSLQKNVRANNEVRFGLAFSPAISTADAESNFGYGGGVTTDWSLSQKFVVSTGIYVAQNHLIYENTGNRLPVLADQNDIRVNLVALDIPINLQYHINDNIFVSAGISSATFMKEDYTYTAEYDKLIKVTTLSESKEPIETIRVVRIAETREISEPSFRSFNLAAFYNFSVGYQYAMGDRYKLSFEPFIKFPAMPVTSGELQYSTGGVQLKLKF
jgi:hypothetical protein